MWLPGRMEICALEHVGSSVERVGVLLDGVGVIGLPSLIRAPLPARAHAHARFRQFAPALTLPLPSSIAHHTWPEPTPEPSPAL